jgi:hypothetical protein
MRIKTFPRDFKFTLGTQLRNECTDLILNIYRANSTRDKVPHIEQISENEQLQILRINNTAIWKIQPAPSIVILDFSNTPTVLA